MGKRFLFTIFFLSILIFAAGQEYWIRPLEFFLLKGGRLVVSLKRGENFMAEFVSVKKGDVIQLMQHYGGKSIDVLDTLKEADRDQLTLTMTEEGTQLLSMHLNQGAKEFGSESFNAFLKEHGLDEALEVRKKTPSTNVVKENSVHFLKLIIQVGEKRDETFKKVLGTPAEIIPEKNPTTLRRGDPVRFKILFDGKPVFGVRVKVWNRFENRTTIQNIYTEQDGAFEARISNAGPWMVSVVRMAPAGNDWQRYQSTLIFGIEK